MPDYVINKGRDNEETIRAHDAYEDEAHFRFYDGNGVLNRLLNKTEGMTIHPLVLSMQDKKPASDQK